MRLTELLKKIQYRHLSGDPDPEITGVAFDSRDLQAGGLFVCIRGRMQDGHRFIPEAQKKGAVCIVVEDFASCTEAEQHAAAQMTVIETHNTRLALAEISAAWFSYPAEELKTIGITGTKGKTTSAYMIRSILENAGMKVGLISTIEMIIGEKHIKAENTTPESYRIQEAFREMADSGCEVVVVEVSSQALLMDRVSGFTFDFGIFTNIESDHISPQEHADFEEYLACKKKLLSQSRIGIVNRDDPRFSDIIEGAGCPIETYGFHPEADYRAENELLIAKPGYLGITYNALGKEELEVSIDIPGRFSIYNSLAAIAVCHHFGVSRENILAALKGAKIRGRIELIPVSDEFTLLIDYAHNAMSLENLLVTLREYHPARLICLFGCGGDRDRSRRFEMGEISGRRADFTILTSDNPRFENPQTILDDIQKGIDRTSGEYVIIPDRKKAIRYAIDMGEPGDIIVLAGKGHEDCLEINGKRIPMDERELIREILEEKNI
ncbi:MAG: UDP-N-acetylmuramoyl-L-alanyl-D-glutamate--2,6-diaminopimelate ligase [Eubacterium sp.]|nr:UDP-N-acetylmuramoyl-L-alanyl-D-glutamate--2,6-diaminopimelate ligase [Eubacterium sp.]